MPSHRNPPPALELFRSLLRVSAGAERSALVTRPLRSLDAPHPDAGKQSDDPARRSVSWQ